MSVEAQQVVGFVFDALAADTAFSSAVGGRIYRDLVPQAAALPAATVTLVSATDVNTLGADRAFETVLVDVRVVMSGSSYGPINAAADRADAVLQNRLGTRGGVAVVELRREQVQTFIETEAGATFAHIIQSYRSEAHA